MATSLALRRSNTAATLFRKLFVTARPIPNERRCFNTNSSDLESEYHDSEYDSDSYDHDDVRRTRLLGIRSEMSGFTSHLHNCSRNECDAKEVNDVLILRFDLPGFDKDTVELSIDGNTLIMEAHKENEEDEAERWGFSRIDLPINIYKLDKMKAGMKNGVLKVKVPMVKTEECKPVTYIEVE